MNRSLLRPLMGAELDKLLDALTAEQYVRPHAPLAQSLARTAEALGVCPGAVDHAVAWLGVNPSKSIGRLRRTELMQLAQSIHRFWRRACAVSAAPPSERPS